MAPLLSFLSLFLLALSTVAVASPHIPRHIHSHGHRAPVALPLPLPVDVDAVPVPLRKRSLNKRCNPRLGNATSVAPSSTVPINVAPAPSIPSSSSSPSVPDHTSSSTSSYVPPATSSQAAATTPTPPPATSSSPPPAETSSSSNSGEPSYLVGTQSGQATYYDTGLGACGITSNDGQNIAAVSELLFDSYPSYDGTDPNSNPVCGKTITITYQGKSVTVTVVDRCVACKITDLDLSPNAFDMLTSAAVGRFDMTWVWG